MSSFLLPGAALSVLSRVAGGLGFVVGFSPDGVRIDRGDLPRWFASWPRKVDLNDGDRAGLVGHWVCDQYSFVLIEAVNALEAQELLQALVTAHPRRTDARPPGWMPSHIHGFQPDDLTALAYRRPRGKWSDQHLVELAIGLGLDAVKLEGGGVLVTAPEPGPEPLLPFAGPFTAPSMGSVILLGDRGMVADFVDGRVRPRGWGKIQYMEHAELRWEAWQRWVELVTKDATSAKAGAQAMNTALTGGAN